MTDAKTIPTADTDPVYYPVGIADLTDTTSEAALAIAEIKSIIFNSNSGLANNYSRCIAALSVGKDLVQTTPSFVPDVMIALCQATGFQTNLTCQRTYTAGSYMDSNFGFG